MSAIALSVNLNKIALLRNSRDGDFPSVMDFARRAIAAGVQGITVHPRPDQRHIRPGDVYDLGELCQDQGNIEFNIEGNPFAAPRGDYPGLIALVERTRPAQCTLVPDNDGQKTSDHGFDLTRDFDRLLPLIQTLKILGTRVSLFMDPVAEHIRLAHKVGADRIELYTGPFAWAHARSPAEGQALFDAHCAAAEVAAECGLGINAGHDLNLDNMRLYRNLPGLEEVSIGHALTVDALLMGFDNAIKAYLERCDRSGTAI